MDEALKMWNQFIVQNNKLMRVTDVGERLNW